MSTRTLKEVPSKGSDHISPQWKQNARTIQKFGTVIRSLPIGIDEKTRTEMCEQLNLMLADTSSLRDLYKKSHWQVGGPTSISFISFLISTSANRLSWLTCWPSGFRLLAASASPCPTTLRSLRG